MLHNQYRLPVHLARKIVCLAVLGACASLAVAEEEDEVARLTRPDSTFSLGIGHVSGDNQRFGVYNGLRKEQEYFLGDFSVVRRDDATWFRADGRNVGLSNGDLRLEHEKQGDWGYFLEVGETPRYTPYEVHSKIQGAGTNNLSYPSTTGQQPKATTTLPTLSTERTGSKLGFNKFFLGDLLEFKVLFQNDEKKGQRPFGRGTVGAQEFLIEPINSVTRQLDVILNYTGDKLQLSGGYYGSWYFNNNNQLNVSGGDAALRTAASPNLPFSVIALPPDNLAHQLHLSGGYQFTDKTRGNFKLAYSRAEQTDTFVDVPAPTSGGLPPGGLNLSGRSDLGGRLDTTLAQVGITSRPISGLSLLGNVRYEDRHDKTDVAKYIFVTGTTASTDGYNEPRSLKVLSGKLEASYQLPQGFRLTGGIDAEQKERTMAGVRIVGYREKTDENSYRLELSRALAESVSGSVAYVRSERTGTGYQNLLKWNTTTNTFNTAAPYSNRVQPIYIADRDRDKLRMLIDWTPLEALSVQFAFEGSEDDYGPGRGTPDIGVRHGNAFLYSVDASYAITERWRLNAWASQSSTHIDQAQGNSTASYWEAALRNMVTAYGLGLRGKVTSAIDVGTDWVITNDRSVYTLGGTAPSSLPDIHNYLTSIKLFGKYAVNRDTSVRIDYVFDHRKTDDWTWNGTAATGPYVYMDGTWLYQKPEDKVHFFGVSVQHSFR